MKCNIWTIFYIVFLVFLLVSCNGKISNQRGFCLRAVENSGFQREITPKLGEKVASIITNKIKFVNNSNDVFEFQLKRDVFNPFKNAEKYSLSYIKYPLFNVYGVTLWSYDANCYFRLLSDGKVLWKFFPQENNYLTDEMFSKIVFIEKSRGFYYFKENGKEKTMLYPKPLNGFKLKDQDHSLDPSYSGVYGIDSTNGNIVLEFIAHQLLKPRVLTFIGKIENNCISIQYYMISKKNNEKLDRLHPIDISATKVSIESLPEVKPIYEIIDELKPRTTGDDKTKTGHH